MLLLDFEDYNINEILKYFNTNSKKNIRNLLINIFII